MKFNLVLATLAAASMLTSCEDLLDENNLQPDGSKPSVTVISPTSNQSVAKSQGLHINISAVDKDAFKDVSFEVSDAKGEKAKIKFNKASDNSRLAFDTLVSVHNLSEGEYTLIINATDKRTNLATQEVKFNVR